MASRPGRITGKAAKRNKWWMNRRNQWIAGGVALALLGAVGISIALDDSSSSTAVEESPGDAYKGGIVADFTTMSNSALNYLKVINDWRTDKAKNSEVDTAASLALQQFLLTRDLLVDRAPFEQAPRALPNYKDAVELYVIHARLAKLGVQAKSDDKLNHQIQLMMGRIRYVADRLYDLGSDELTPFTVQDREVEGFDYTRAVDVPSFAGTDLAPGPPLTLAKPAASQAREYQDVRPEVDFATWQAAVEAAKVPTTEVETKAIKDASQDELDKLAEQLTAASDHLHNAPDPLDERELSTRVQLGLLVQAEAMRSAQVTRLVPAGDKAEAVEITHTLAVLGNSMWDDRLGARDTGYPSTLLTKRPAVAPPPIDEGLLPETAPPVVPGAPDPGAPGAGAPDPGAGTTPSTAPSTEPSTEPSAAPTP